MGKIEDLIEENRNLKAKVEVLEDMLGKLMMSNRPSGRTAIDESVNIALRQMTQKQHAALQMVLRGASNFEIAHRFQVTESTAKVYVKGIMDRLGVRSRPQIVSKAAPFFDRMDDYEYQVISGGVPKDWDMHWSKYDDVNKMLFEKTRGRKDDDHDTETGG